MHVYLIFSSNLYTGNLGWVLTNIIKFFLTLSNVKRLEPNLTIEMIESRVKSLFSEKGVDILIVREIHSSGVDFHYHCAIVRRKGLGKNVYIKLFRDIFPLFTGRTIDIQRVKSLAGVIKYILKFISVNDIINLLCTGVSDTIFCSNLSFFLEKNKGYSYAVIVSKIINFSSLHRFLIRDFDAYTISLRKTKLIETCWNSSRTFLKLPLVLEEIKSVSYVSIDEFLLIIEKYDLQWVHLEILYRILFFILIKEGIVDQPVKSKNLVIIGEPNTGKTRLLFKIIEVFNNNRLFYFVGSRINDFSGFQPNLKPIIVFDDVLKTNPYLNWDEGLLLKVLGHEPFNVDVKYGIPIQIPPRNCIIITNNVEIFDGYKNIHARVAKFDIEKIHANWHRISNDDFKKLVFILLEDLSLSIKIPSLYAFLTYGVFDNDFYFGNKEDPLF